MRTVASVIGVLAVLMGLLWIGQGLDIIHWPESSFMLDQRIWSIYGAVLALVGAGIIFWARRRA